MRDETLAHSKQTIVPPPAPTEPPEGHMAVYYDHVVWEADPFWKRVFNKLTFWRK